MGGVTVGHRYSIASRPSAAQYGAGGVTPPVPRRRLRNVNSRTLLDSGTPAIGDASPRHASPDVPSTSGSNCSHSIVKKRASIGLRESAQLMDDWWTREMSGPACDSAGAERAPAESRTSLDCPPGAPSGSGC